MAGVMRDNAALVEPEDLAAQISYRVRLVQIAAYKTFEKVVSGHGTAPRYYGMLRIVEANPGIPQARLAEAVFLDRSSLVPILDALGREGWLERRATRSDRRVRRVFLTQEGRARLLELGQEVARHEAMMTAGLSEAEKAQLLNLLDRIDANLRVAFAGGIPDAVGGDVS